MRHVGYINNAQNIDIINKGLPQLKQLQCHTVYIEDKEDKERLAWKRFVSELGEGDVAILLSFNNAFKSFSDLMFFLKLCSGKRIRIISVQDALDSSDELFPHQGTQCILSAIAGMSRKNAGEYDDFEAELISEKRQEKKLKKYRMVINMYNAGYSIREIMSKTGYRGKSNIYRVLHMYNVELGYPTMVRTRPFEENVIQRNL